MKMEEERGQPEERGHRTEAIVGAKTWEVLEQRMSKTGRTRSAVTRDAIMAGTGTDPVCREALAQAIAATAQRTGKTFVLSTGKTSDTYFDMKAFTCQPEGLKAAARVVREKAQEVAPTATWAGGVATGASFLTCGVVLDALATGWNLQGCVIRKEEKGHGLMQRIENPPPQGAEVIVLDDVATSGTSLGIACEAFLAEAAKPIAAIVLVDREEGAAEALWRKHRVELHGIFTKQALQALQC